MWAKFSAIILRNRIPIFIVLGLLTAFMGYQATFVRMNYEMSSVLPEDDTTFLDFEGFKAQFGQDGSVLILGFQDERIFELDQFVLWHQLSKDLKNVVGVDEVLSVPTVGYLKKNTEEKKFTLEPLFPEPPTSQAQLDSLFGVFKSLPFYRNIIYNDTSGTYLTALTLDRKKLDSKDRGELMEQIVELCDQYEAESGIKMRYSGLPFIRANTTSKISEEIKLFIFLAALITALIMLLFFRSFRAMFFSMIVVLTGVVWAFGWIGIMRYKITMLTGLIPPLIIVIGIPNCIFLLNKYLQEYKSHGNQIKALSRVIQKIGNAIFLTNATTSMGFATFIFTKSRVLIEFGIVTSLSILCVFLLSITLIPIIFSFNKPPIKRHTKHLENQWMGLAIDRMVNLVLNRRTAIYVTTVVVVLVGVVGITKIKTTGNIADDLPRDDQVYVDLKFFERNFHGVIPFEIMIDTKGKGKAMKLSTLKKIEKLEKEIAKFDEFSKPISIVSAVKFSKQAFYNGKESRYKLFNNQEKSFMAPYLTNKGDSSKTLNSFVDPDRQITRISIQMKDIGTEQMDDLIEQVRPVVDSIFNPEKYDVTLTGTSVVFLKGTTYLVKNLFTSLMLAIVVIAILMSFLFSSIRMVLVSLIPNLLPLVVTAGAMGWFGIPLKPSTILIFSIAFGISVDDTIHYLAKYRQELKAHRINLKMAVIEALRETGISMIYTSIVLFFGFGVFTASEFGGTVALGLLVSFTLLVAMNANLILLPSLLLSLERSVTTKAFEKEALIEIFDEEEDIELDELMVRKNDEKNE